MNDRIIAMRRLLPWMIAIIIGALLGGSACWFNPPLTRDGVEGNTEIRGLAEGGSNPPGRPGVNYITLLSHTFENAKDGSAITITDYCSAQRIVAAWMQDDVVACLNYLKETGRLSLVSSEALRRAVSHATDDNLAQAISLSNQVSSGNMREEVLRIAFATAVDRDPEGAVQFLSHVPRHLYGEICDDVMQHWIAKDGRKAAQKLLEGTGFPPTIVTRGLLAFAMQDLKSAVSLILADPRLDRKLNPTAAIDNYVLLSRIFGMSSKIPAEQRFDSLLTQLPAGLTRNAYLAHAASELIAADPSNGRAIIDRLSTSHMKNTALIEASRWMKPSDTLKLLEEATSVTKQIEILAPAAARLVRQDPKEALAFTESVTNPLLKAKCLRMVMQQWYRVSPKQAMDYSAQQWQEGRNDVLSQVISDMFSSSLNDPVHTGWGVDTAKLNDLSPATKAALRDRLQAGLPEADFRRIEPFLR